ncbi:MAG: ribosome maturation factor RimM [Chloroflexota bacterium]
MPQQGQGGPGEVKKAGAGREEPRFLAVGELTGPHGVKGEIRLRVLTEFPERFQNRRRVFVGEDHRPFAVEGIRAASGRMLVKLAGIDSPEAARDLQHHLVYVPTEEAAPLEEDRYYWYQIVGLEVWTTDGRLLGTVDDIIPTGSNDVYVVRGPQGEVLVPAIEDVVVAVDLEHGRLTIEPMEGML